MAKIWEKYIFISTTATVTSYYNKTFGEIKKTPECRRSLKRLIEECYTIAEYKKIVMPKDMKKRIWDKFINLPPDTTTSMHSDFVSGKGITEVYSLTGYLIEEAQKYDLVLPKYQEMYKMLISNQYRND
ncbi:2-dehydropantoate 2-reductase [compost metagenome]